MEVQEVSEQNNADDHRQNANGSQDDVAHSYLWLVILSGAVAVLGLLLASIYWPNLSERTKFFTGNLLNLVIALAVIAQVLIYRAFKREQCRGS